MFSKAGGRDVCTFGLSGCRVKPRRPHQTGPPGLARQPEGPGASNTTKIPRKDPKREEEERKMRREEGKKSAKFWAPHPSGLHPFGALQTPFGAPPFGAPPFGAPPFRVPRFGAPPFGASTLSGLLGSTLRGPTFSGCPNIQHPKIGRSRARIVRHQSTKGLVGPPSGLASRGAVVVYYEQGSGCYRQVGGRDSTECCRVARTNCSSVVSGGGTVPTAGTVAPRRPNAPETAGQR